MTTTPRSDAPAAKGNDRPESDLQLALDQTSLADASRLVTQLAPTLTRVEIGTPLVLAAGLGAVEHIRRLSRRTMTIVADVKICDAGEKIARNAFEQGADVVTAVAAAIDEVTWRGVLAAAGGRGHAVGEPAPILLDTIGPEIDLDALDEFAGIASDIGVRVDLCVHRPKIASPGFADLIRPIGERELGFDRLIVAGNLGPTEVRAALDAGFGTLIVGGAVANADDPTATWNAFRAEVHEWRRRSG